MAKTTTPHALRALLALKASTNSPPAPLVRTLSANPVLLLAALEASNRLRALPRQIKTACALLAQFAAPQPWRFLLVPTLPTDNAKIARAALKALGNKLPVKEPTIQLAHLAPLAPLIHS